LLLAAGPVAAGLESKVRIEGGFDPESHSYRWTVHNEAASPIVFAAFPQQQADLFTGPPGWEVRGRENEAPLRNESGALMFSAQAPAGAPGIGPGRSGEFEMRIKPKKSPTRGKGEVWVKFADGREAWIGGVEVPLPPTASSKYLRLIALAILFAVFVVGRSLWNRRRRSGAVAPQADARPSEPQP